jgi:thiamine kinase-like enzyme
MEINELKKMLKSSNAVLVIDNGEPSFVIMDYSSYKELAKCEVEKEVKVKSGESSGSTFVNRRIQNSQTSKPESELELLEKINKDILALKDEIEKEQKLQESSID